MVTSFALPDKINDLYLEALSNELCYFGCGNSYVKLAHNTKNALVFYSNFDINGEIAYFVLKFYKSYAKVTSGLLLKQKEKTKRFNYKNYKTVERLLLDISVFARNYFNSFKLARK